MVKCDYKFRQVNDLKAYVRQLIDHGAGIITAEKTARIAARPGIPGEEKIISWSVDADGNPVREKDAVVSADESGTPDWVASKIDEEGKEIIDANGHVNRWIIRDETFRRKYEAVPGQIGRAHV